MEIESIVSEIERAAKRCTDLAVTAPATVKEYPSISLVLQDLGLARLKKSVSKNKTEPVQPGLGLALLLGTADTPLRSLDHPRKPLGDENSSISQVIRAIIELLDEISHRIVPQLDVLNTTWQDDKIRHHLGRLSRLVDRGATRLELRGLYRENIGKLQPSTRLQWAELCDSLSPLLMNFAEISAQLTQLHARARATLAAFVRYQPGQQIRPPVGTTTTDPSPAPHSPPATANGKGPATTSVDLSGTTEANPGPVDHGSATAAGTQSMSIKIFISHSSKDADLAEALIRCIEASATVPEGAIRCTSVSGYKLPVGAEGPRTLRENIKSAMVVIGVLTSNSIQSGFVLAELGAAWGLEKVTCPLLVPPVDFSALPPVLKDTHAIRLLNRPDVAQFMSDLAQYAGLPEAINHAKRTAAVDSLVALAERT